MPITYRSAPAAGSHERSQISSWADALEHGPTVIKSLTVNRLRCVGWDVLSRTR